MAYFLMRCLHHPDQDAQRDKLRADHRGWVGSGGQGLVSVLIGAALQNENGAANGNFGILQAKTSQDARRFAEGDPFALAGIVRLIEITPLPDGFQAGRITEPMSPLLDL
ncbi:YciI family protein [Paracoccus tegillarcae]|uniref:YCII-related domain-containing protein n=1 Tax=Paracoccus tegillarcae TaxID=1529068 RepID=A0A2K9EM15_9RHOB|nr:YciI family protein [Paracoccus tegillarcae]AUH32635.1 hypothetical protein CUV01_03885 [Paracoccus tegillarcae]